MKTKYWLLALVTPVAIACQDDDPTPNPPSDDFESGVFISNEGPFQGGNGTLSFYDPAAKTVESDVFLAQTGRPLGNVVNSVSTDGEYVFIVANNSGAVEIADAGTLESVQTISGMSQPRHALAIGNDILAVSDWGTGTVDFFNFKTGATIASVSTGNGPERMMMLGDRLLVANSGGFGIDSTVTIINTNDYTVDTNIVVGVNPNSFARSTTNVFVLCGGYTDWGNTANNRDGSIVKVDFTTLSSTLIPATAGLRPTGLVINSNQSKLFFLSSGYSGDLMSMDVTATSFPSAAVGLQVPAYALGYDAQNDELYVSDAADYASNGSVYRYDYINDEVVDQFTVGIIPGGFAFIQ